MVRLVSSRVHRCYSRSGGHSSARNERLTDTAHFCGSLLLLLNRNNHIISLKNSSFVEYAGAIGGFLVVGASLSDLYAALIAHRMFYKWSKSGKKTSGFWSTATKVDALVSLLFLFGSLLWVGTTVPFVNRTNETNVRYVVVASAVAVVLGVAVNFVGSIPSLDFRVPGTVARSQNLVVLYFFLGAVGRVCAAFGAIFHGDEHGIITFTDEMFMVADSLILCGSAMNWVRVMVLLRTVHHWTNNEVRGENEQPPRGLLSWFKSSRSNPEMSDYESDIEDTGFDTDEERRTQTPHRRSTWSRM